MNVFTPDVIRLVLIGTMAVTTLMFVLWIYQAVKRNAGVVDLGWVLGLILLANLYAWQLPGFALRKLLILTMVVCWGFRLAFLLLGRLTKDSQEDKRYQKIRADWKTNVDLKFFFLFQLQALLDVVLAIPFLLICLNPAPRMEGIECLGISLWLIGFVGEMTADRQLKQFKSNPENKGKTCQVGLWNYSRHPNYFFEWMVWVGYFVFALGSPGGAITIICPIIMYYFLIYVTGVPTAEAQSLLSRGEEYRRYQQSTSMFFPLPKRKI
jgi:steroid 5-alpha reductase family enzyme